MAFYNRTEIGLKKTSTAVNVPDDPKAKLMYYLNCMCTVLRLDEDDDINRLRKYQNYISLSESDTFLLINLCMLLKPDVLLNKCIFQSDDLCGGSNNAFYEIETVRNNVLVAGSIMIGGRERRVAKIMAFKMSWLRNFWVQPMETLMEQMQRRLAAIRARERESSCCVII